MRGDSFAEAIEGFGRRLHGSDDALKTWHADPPSPHDLRRMVGTRLAELRIPKEIRDRVLNHAPSDVGSKHYNLHDYADEKRNALHRWAAVVETIVTGASAAVVSISAAQR
jgi:integrase